MELGVVALIPSGRDEVVRGVKDQRTYTDLQQILVETTLAGLDDFKDEESVEDKEMCELMQELVISREALGPESTKRKKIVNYVVRKYLVRQPGYILCPACLRETRNRITICCHCWGGLISIGTRLEEETVSPQDDEEERIKAEKIIEISEAVDEVLKETEEVKDEEIEEDDDDVIMEIIWKRRTSWRHTVSMRRKLIGENKMTEHQSSKTSAKEETSLLIQMNSKRLSVNTKTFRRGVDH